MVCANNLLGMTLVGIWLAVAPMVAAAQTPGFLSEANSILTPIKQRPVRENSVLKLGATGPGIDYTDKYPALNGALVPETGWPEVLLDHFAPRPEKVQNLWLVQTRSSTRELGPPPWKGLRVSQLNAAGYLVEVPLENLLAQAVGRPVVVQVLGYATTPDLAFGSLFWTNTFLRKYQALPEEAVVIAFDWPASREYWNTVCDINHKSALAEVSGYHLAWLVQALPPNTRVCLMGQSCGGRIVSVALHFLGGGSLESSDGRMVKLPGKRPDLQVYGIIVAASIDRHWLLPGERLGRALHGCCRFLNLYNRQDRTLLFYPLLFESDHRRAVGRVGLWESDLQRLGALRSHYRQIDMYPLLKHEHSLSKIVAHPQSAAWIAPYTGAR